MQPITGTYHRRRSAAQLCFNFDTKNFKIFSGSKETQFGYTVQQHEAGGRQCASSFFSVSCVLRRSAGSGNYVLRLLVGAPFESTGKQQTGDVYRCPLDTRMSANCTRAHLGKLSLDNVSERKDKMRLGMSLTSNPRDNSFVTCGPLWSHECGSSLYSTGICSRVSRNFRQSHTIAPALQRCETFMDIVIVLDGSNSIYPWYEVQDFLINILHKFYIGPGQTQVGVVQYGSTVVHEFTLGEYQTVEEVVEAARGIDQRGGEETRTALGINVGRSEAFKRGGRPGAQKVMIVITDGESHDSPQLVQAVGDSERDNITMYAIAVLGYYNRRGINPEAFLKEIKFIASDPDEKHFFNVTDESALKDIVDALGERIFSLEGTSSQGRGFGLQMAQAGFSSHLVKDGILLGAVGAYDWNGAVLKETKHGKVVPPKSSYKEEFPEELKNHGAYLGYSVGSLISSRGAQLYVAGAPRFNHTGKVIVFTLKNNGNLTILQGCLESSELLSMDVDGDGHTDVLLVAAPMYYSQGRETGRVYIYSVTSQASLVQQGALQADRSQNSRLGSALTQIPDMNGDGFRELVVGAPLEDDHQGRCTCSTARTEASRDVRDRYFGRSLHGSWTSTETDWLTWRWALGAAVVIWSRGVVRIQAKLTFEPEKVNIFNKDCWREGRRSPDQDQDQDEDSGVVQSAAGRETFSSSSRPGRTGMVDPDEGPVLDPDWPSVLRAELPFWTAASRRTPASPTSSSTVASTSWTFILQLQGPAVWSLCSQQRAPLRGVFVVESGRRRLMMFSRLENLGENAYGASINISTSSNLIFSSLVVKDQSDVQIDCSSEDRLLTHRFCNISAPFMKSLSQ
ncbi:hypothetical protein INR49_022729 [Caranx melampygus]|nr:hypothetical protein INR49_022729 [Caranx melampygus]